MVRTFGRAAVLLAASALCVVLAAVLFTDIGAGAAFRLGVRLNSEEVDTSDNAYLEYYDVRSRVGDFGSYRIYIGGDSDSYAAALDFLKFIKQNDSVNIIRLDSGDADSLNAYLGSGDTELLSACGLDDAASGFVKSVYTYNMILPPQKKLSFVTGRGAEEGEYIICVQPYDGAEAREGVLDISCIYPGHEDCDPLFDIKVDASRFGSTDALSGYIGYLGAVSGNLGRKTFDGLGQPEYYFIMADPGLKGTEQ